MAALMPDTTTDTPDTISGTVLFPVTKTAQYAARLLLWQWKQWLNRGTDWNNLSVCPLVPQTSCLTKPNPCWCWAFRPVSLCFCLSLFHLLYLSVFLAEPTSTLRVTGCWPNLFLFLLAADSNVNSHCEEVEDEEEKRRERGGEGEGKDTEGCRESKIRGKVKQAWNRELKSGSTRNNTLVTWK